MPYASNDQLPDGVKNALPAEAQSIWRNAFNSGEKQFPGDESRAARIAWGAVENAGWKKSGDKWVKATHGFSEEKAIEYAIEKEKADEPIKPDDGEKSFWIEIFKVGKWKGDFYSKEDLEDMVRNFDLLRGEVKPPVKVGHNTKGINRRVSDGQPAYGWIEQVKLVGDKLLGLATDVPAILKKAIEHRSYRRLSAEIYWNVRKGAQLFKRVLGAVSFLGSDIPAVSTLEDLQALYSGSTAFEAGSFERMASYAFDVDDGHIMTERRDDNTMTPEEIKALEEENKNLKAQNKTYSEQAENDKNERIKDRKESSAKDLKTFCEKLVEDGSMTPAGRDVLIKDLEEKKYVFTDDAGYGIPVDTLKRFFETEKKTLLEMKKQNGKHNKNDNDKDKFDSAAEEIDAKTRKYMSEQGNKISYEDAQSFVLASDDDLAERYLDETPRVRTVEDGGDDDE